jgi:uracil-DNA glycosylase
MVSDSLLEPIDLWSHLPKSWQDYLPDSRQILNDISAAISEPFFPDLENIFAAFKLPPPEIKVLLLGQDPYPTPGFATGLAFGVANGNRIPGSLRNIALELGGLPAPTLESWQLQGVLLLNRELTYSPGANGKNAHLGIGWQKFTNMVISELAKTRVIALALGKVAEAALSAFPSERLLTTSHPSPLSAHRGFLGSGIFDKVNERLSQQGITKVNWR